MNATTIKEEVILVNEQDETLGTMEKYEAHRRGVLHRAFSVFLFDVDGRVLLQQRAAGKYHSASLWTNTCCSHPRPGENIALAAERRLREEMGLNAELEHRFTFTYRTDVGNDLVEHELDHVFFGRATSTPELDPEEVQAWRYIDVDELTAELEAQPERFTAWLHICWPLVCDQLLKKRA
jgi:isopentenyl-diphosphate delta-isomerase